MYRIVVAVVGLSMLAGMGGGGGEAAAVAAQANARAPGPVSEHDAYLLERYGCLSGTDSAVCKRLEHRGWHRQNQRHRRDNMTT
jgi:hypothetical protein